MMDAKANNQHRSPLHANAMNLMAQRGEASAIERSIALGSDPNECDGEWFPLVGVIVL